jgi:hypothetical protein
LAWWSPFLRVFDGGAVQGVGEEVPGARARDGSRSRNRGRDVGAGDASRRLGRVPEELARHDLVREPRVEVLDGRPAVDLERTLCLDRPGEALWHDHPAEVGAQQQGVRYPVAVDVAVTPGVEERPGDRAARAGEGRRQVDVVESL